MHEASRTEDNNNASKGLKQDVALVKGTTRESRTGHMTNLLVSTRGQTLKRNTREIQSVHYSVQAEPDTLQFRRSSIRAELEASRTLADQVIDASLLLDPRIDLSLDCHLLLRHKT